MLIADPTTRDFVHLTKDGDARIGHLPGLDGLRGLAVIVVIAFHAGYERMVGGYLGVSTFFTLSGFLITSLLLNESRRTGTVSLRSFWGRRFRRLMPASLTLLAAVMLLFGPFVANADQRATMKGDVLSSVFDVANWHFILSGSSYGALFSSPSPVLHFWSLAIEEQFYLLFPLVLLGAWALTRGRRPRLGAVFGGLALLSFLEPLVFTMSHDRIYFGTDTRAAELLLGAVLAVVLSSEPVRRVIALRYSWRTGVVVVGGLALAVQAWWWWSLPQSTDWLYSGGFGLYALLTCAVITATALPTGPLRTAMSARWLRWIGARSYGLYLIHWPVFLTVRQTWPDLGRNLTTLVAVSTSVLLAMASYRWIERPIRSGRWPVAGSGVRVAALGVASVAVLALAIPLPVRAGERTVDFDQALSNYHSIGRNRSTSSTTTPLAVPTPGIAWYGDSTALLAAMGFGPWGDKSGKARFVEGEPVLGCGVSRFTSIKANETFSPTDYCKSWPTRWATKLAATKPDIAILMSSVWEIGDARLPGTTKYAGIGTPQVDAFIHSEFLKAVDVLSSTGALVILPTIPHQGSWAADGKAQGAKLQALPARTDRLNEIFAQVAAERPDTVRLIDFAGWLGDRSQDRTLRPDGVHIQAAQFEELSKEWFGPQVLAAWDAWWKTHRAPGTAGAPTAAPGPDGPTTTTTEAPSDAASPSGKSTAAGRSTASGQQGSDR
jgi:peptidoglycan/LPS O-acetylase OafA/YrhL